MIKALASFFFPTSQGEILPLQVLGGDLVA